MRSRGRVLGWVMIKDLAILRRSPLLVGILVLYPVALALIIGLALGAPTPRARVAVYTGVPAGHGRVQLGGTAIDIGAYTRELSGSITPVRVPSVAAATADVRNGVTEAAIIVPADIVAQVESLVRNGVGTPTVRLILDNANPIERDLVSAQIQTRIDQVQAAIAKALLATALTDLHTVVAGGQLSFAGANVDLLGLSRARRIVAGAIPQLSRTALGGRLGPPLRRVVSFADIAIEGLSFASPVLGQLQNPLTVARTSLTAVRTPTAAYAVAIAVTVSELFLAMLLAASLLALERSEQVYARLVRGPAGPVLLLVAKLLLAAAAAAAVTFVMSAVVSVFVPLSWGRVELWVLVLLVAGLAFAALGVALGAVAREVAAASLLAILVGLPVAFLALIPPSAISTGLGNAVAVISFLFPFKAALGATAAALTGGGSGLALTLVHLLGLALAFGGLARVALRRFAAAA
ncbi:ABC transporter permease [Conexibacter sp. DBS9H8]|uniref:ABC transporter permease n=1 Tax=Conexibacter sp. DBS9H8 TaxID=2937801 RepID=UPI00200CFB73|nr:ABC transporter permease [Conexibacter sp. DBS9H8]